MPFISSYYVSSNIFLGYSIACLCAHSSFLPPESKVCTSWWWDFSHSKMATLSAYRLLLSPPHERLKPFAVEFLPLRVPICCEISPAQSLTKLSTTLMGFFPSETKNLLVPLMWFLLLENNTASLPNYSITTTSMIGSTLWWSYQFRSPNGTRSK